MMASCTPETPEITEPQSGTGQQDSQSDDELSDEDAAYSDDTAVPIPEKGLQIRVGSDSSEHEAAGLYNLGIKNAKRLNELRGTMTLEMTNFKAPGLTDQVFEMASTVLYNEVERVFEAQEDLPLPFGNGRYVDVLGEDLDRYEVSEDEDSYYLKLVPKAEWEPVEYYKGSQSRFFEVIDMREKVADFSAVKFDGDMDTDLTILYDGGYVEAVIDKESRAVTSATYVMVVKLEAKNIWVGSLISVPSASIYAVYTTVYE
ncbi:MAG: hypothetical protein LIO46_05305 [Clostridiales bacterium]|nr:hypothetical protein [Clostridiales bacterium]